MSTEEDLFVGKALASVEKAEKVQRARRIALTVVALAAAFWLGSKGPSPELNVECTVLIGVGLMIAISTAKIMSLVNRNTRTILQASCR